jgi:hypothetical protein
VFLNLRSLKPILLTFNYYFQSVTRCNVIRCAALEFLNFTIGYAAFSPFCSNALDGG